MWLYILFLHIAALFNAKARKLVDGEKKALDCLTENIDKNARYIWFHAASVGEFEQARPIIEKIKEEGQNTKYKVLLTFFSPSGYELRKNYKGADLVCYLPFATRHNAKRFLDIVKPVEAVFVKYEFWPAYLKELKHRDIPTYIIAAVFRQKQLFFKWYGYWYRRLLHCFTTLFVQDDASKQLLADYGINNVIVAGDPRFDRVAEIAKQSKEDAVLEAFSPQIIAGSTWQPDEKLLLRFFREHKDLRLMIVPHELDKNHLNSLKKELGNEMIFYTEATIDNVKLCRCLVLNTMGMLSSAYRYGKIAYIGGGFGVGIHNTLEAAVYGMPVVFGPSYRKFREAKDLISCGGGFSVCNYEELKKVFDTLLVDCQSAGKQAGDYVAAHSGATERILESIII